MTPIIFRNRLDPDNVSDGATLIAWENVTFTATDDQAPLWTAYMKPLYDVVSGQSIWYLHRDTSSIIYSTDLYFYNSATRVFTRIGGTGSLIQVCSDGSGSVDRAGNPKLPWPPDRHPVEELAIDTSRNVLHLVNGVCATAEDGPTLWDQWSMVLNADPDDNAWVLGLTGQENLPSIENVGSIEYSTADDILVFHGTHTGNFPRTWVYALGSGDPSAAQLAAGCTARGVWFETYTVGVQEPPASYFSSIVYAPNTGKVYHMGHDGESVVWEYDIPAKTWTDMAPTGDVPEEATLLSQERLVSYLSSGALAGNIFYHRTAHSGTPGVAGDYLYSPVANTWTQLPSTGTGPRGLTFSVFDPTLGNHGGIVAFTNDTGLWHGVFQ